MCDISTIINILMTTVLLIMIILIAIIIMSITLYTTKNNIIQHEDFTDRSMDVLNAILMLGLTLVVLLALSNWLIIESLKYYTGG